ncbi:membrane protein of ER body 2-like isoform X2 [Rosa chinensis]|uniref:membrane protein of ER body 2-like isoform X2 n=1 Tax=Rosa chinensis TaxID=74649 RepID=UPI001AD8A325|nr:membrane protein of ER body 2-like isoform X2 [Rosa chinensis]
MEAPLERLPRQNSNTDITTNNGGNVVYSLEEGKRSPRNGTHMVSDKRAGTELLYGATSNSGHGIVTVGVESVRFQKSVETKHQDEDTRKLKDLGSSSSEQTEQSPEENGVAKHRKIKLRDLEGVFEKTAAHEFYCPNCNACITEVIVRDRESKPPTPPLIEPDEPKPPTPPLIEPEERVRCTSCFGLLFRADEPKPPTPPLIVADEPSCFGLLFRAGTQGKQSLDTGTQEPTEGTTVITVIKPPEQTPAGSELPRDANNMLEILKSIVYGGLNEAIASLSIVASAASTDTATLNIFVLALANLLGGLFVIGHNLWDLKADQVDSKYKEVLGNKDNFFFHVPVAILSFLIFGLVPPLVYGFSFSQSDDSNLKIAAVAASSILCIILLAIGKAYIQTPPKYIKTVLYYIVIGVGAAGVSYLVGDLIDKLVEKLGWFNSTVAGSLPLPHLTMSTVKPAWESW